MTTPRKSWLWLGCCLLVSAALVSGIIFSRVVVGQYGGTNVLSVMFGWQWLYLALGSLIALVVALIKKRRSLATAALVVLFSLAAVFVPARIIASTGLYITGGAGPAGPRFNCLVWEHSDIGLGYDAPPWNDICILMSIPSYNKFLIDQRPDADRSDASPTYYAMFVVNEVLIISGLGVAYRLLTRQAKKLIPLDKP